VKGPFIGIVQREVSLTHRVKHDCEMLFDADHILFLEGPVHVIIYRTLNIQIIHGFMKIGEIALVNTKIRIYDSEFRFKHEYAE